MDESRGIATCGGGQLVAGMRDLPDQVHGFGVGGSSRRKWYSAERVASGSHSLAVLASFNRCLLRNLGWISSGEHIERGAGMQYRCCDAGGVWILDNTVDSTGINCLYQGWVKRNGWELNPRVCSYTAQARALTWQAASLPAGAVTRKTPPPGGENATANTCTIATR